MLLLCLKKKTSFIALKSLSVCVLWFFICLSSAVAGDINGPWLISGSLIDENGKALEQIENVVFFYEKEGSLTQLSNIIEPERTIFTQSEDTRYSLQTTSQIFAYAGFNVFSQVQLSFSRETLELSGLVESGDVNLSYEGSGRLLHPIQLENSLFTWKSGLSAEPGGQPLLFQVNIPEQTAGLRVRLIDGRTQEELNDFNVKLTVIHQDNSFLGSVDEKSFFLSELVRENPQAGLWYIAVGSDTSFSDVVLVVEVGDVLDDGMPTGVTDSTDAVGTGASGDTSSTDAGSTGTGSADVVTVDIIKPHVGWWWDPAESGRGFSIEFQDEKGAENKQAIFFGAYLYNDAGVPVWNTALLEPVKDKPNGYQGSLLDFRDGTTITSGRYFQPRLIGTVGQVNVTVIDEDHIQLNWPGGNTIIESFQFATSSAQRDIENGWWWNPFTPGQGYFMEQQGEVIYFVSYLYNETGDAVWYAAWLTGNTSVKKGAPEYNGRLIRYSGGQTLTGSYVAPFPPEDIGQVSLVFLTEGLATIDWPGGKQTIQRFYFRK